MKKKKTITKKNENGKIAVVYARYSSHGQTEQSIEGQLAAARAYADAKGYTIVHEYIDRAMTGRNDNRDEFQKMLSDTARGQFGVIIVWKVDRFGRNREEITFNKHHCKKNGVRVEYVAENLPDSPESVILESVLEGMAEYYSLQLSQNVSRGLYESAKKHKAIGGHTSLGYRIDKDKKYVIDPETAPTVRMIFNMYAKGQTITEIVRQLNEMGLRTASGRLFRRTSLDSMLKNERYIGTYRYKDLICDEDAIPAIVDKKVFYKIHEMLKINRRMPSRKRSYTDYLLTNRLFCGKCGAPMSGVSGFGHQGNKYSYYSCNTQRTEKTCTQKPVRQDWIEQRVLQEIQKILRDDTLLAHIAENTWQYYLEQDETQEKLRTIQTQIANTEKSLANFMQVIEHGVVSDTVLSRIDGLEAQKAALKAAMADAELKRGFHLTKEHIIFFLEQFRDLDVTDRDCQRRLVETFVNSIFLYDDHITLTFNFGGSGSTITLADVEAATEKGFVCCTDSPTIFT